MHINFDGKTGIVTGAASGIGKAIADAYANAGGTVIVADLKQEAADAAAAEIVARGGKAFGFAGDVSKDADAEAMIRFAEEKTGALHHLVNNAGIGGEAAPVSEYTPGGFRKVVDVNLTGVYLGMHFGIPAMKRAGGGAVVNVASMLGYVGFAGSSGYVAAKHGVIGLTKAAALDHAKDNIRFNSIGPGFIRTPLVDANLNEDTKRLLASKHAIERLGEPDEVAGLTLFLLSDQASFITGSYHLVDGGYTAA